MKYTRKKNFKKKNKNKNKKTRKSVLLLKGGAWYSFFLPLFGDKSENDKIEKDVNTEDDKKENDVKTENEKKKDANLKKNIKTVKTAKELYKIDPSDERIEKEFYPNPNIMTWCFNEPNYKPVGIVHVTSVVGVNILRKYATTVRNIVGVKGTIDENMHQLRNELYVEIENVMNKKNIDKICNLGVAFAKDSGSLILSAFGTALRKVTMD